MVSNEFNCGRALRIAVGITMLALFLAGGVGGTIQATNVEVRGNVVNEPDTPLLSASWDAQSFPGFYYDFNNGRQTETLAITETLSTINTTNSRSISKENLWYNTTKVDVEFKMYEKENVQVLNSDVFQLVGWQAEKYVAVNGKANKLAKLALEMDKEDKKTLTTGETWALGSGYELKVNAIDFRTTPRQVWFTIKKDGAVVDEGIGQAPAGSTIVEKQKGVYTKTMTILGESDSLLFTVYVDTIFSGTTSDMVQFKYAWLIDASTAKEIKSDDVYGVFKVRTTSDTDIKMSSDSAVNLSRNSETNIFDNLKFKVADNDTLRFYPYSVDTNPGRYEVRGTVFDKTHPIYSNTNAWNALNFQGLWYEIDTNTSTEELIIDDKGGCLNYRAICKDDIIYSTHSVKMPTSNPEIREYYIMGWQGEKFAPIYTLDKLTGTVSSPNASNISRWFIDNGSMSLSVGETWNLGNNYELTLTGISDNSGSLVLKKNGNIVYSTTISPGVSADIGTHTMLFTKSISGVNDVPIFSAYVDISGSKISLSKVYLLSDDPVNISGGEEIGMFNVIILTDTMIVLTNEYEDISLYPNSQINLLGNLGFKVGGNWSDLIFYPFSSKTSQISPPLIEIITPSNNSTFLQGEMISLSGSASGSPSPYRYDWTSSIDGYIGNQSKVSLFSLSLGIHTITFKVSDADGLINITSRTIEISPRYIVELRGNVVSDPGTIYANWSAQSFSGFYYDLKNDRQTETLEISETLSKLNITRSISKENLWYNTTKVGVNYKMNDKEGVTVLGGATYQLVGWQAEKYVAIGGKANKLAKLALEMDTEETKTMTTGETWSLGSGYELTINAVDARAMPRLVWFTIKKDGAVIDEGIVQAPTGSTADKQKAVYTKTMTILGESGSLLFTVYVDTIFSGATSDMVQFKYAWLIDASTAKEIKSDDVYGVFKVRSASDTDLKLSSDSAVSLSKNTDTTLMGNLKFRTADSDQLRFYPFVTYTDAGSYEVRGSVVSSPGTTYANWNAQSFAGFYYDLKTDSQTETLEITEPLGIVNASGRLIDKENLWYNTTKVDVEFKMHEKENVQVLNSDVYQLVGWLGEKYVAVGGRATKQAKLALEMDKEDKKTMTTGETWALGSGYELTVNAIDIKTVPRQVWFTLKKDGTVLDEAINMAPVSSTIVDKQKAVYTKTKTILGESDSLLFTVYVDTIFSSTNSDMVQFKYAWLIDANNAIEIKCCEDYGVFKIRTSSDNDIRLSSDSTVNLSKNTEVNIIGNIKFKVADSDTLRFYPKIEYIINENSSGVNGTDTIGVYQNSIGNFFLKNSITPGPADEIAQYGPGGTDFLPMVGDWNGDGTDTIGVYQISTGYFFLKNSITLGPADEIAQYGPGGADFLPMVGDWNGNGTDTIGVYQISTGYFFLKNSITPGPADEIAQYGPGGADFLPMVGDWNGDGTDTIGVYQISTGNFFLKNSITPGPADEIAQYGPGGADFLPMVGDWNGDGTDTIGVYCMSTGNFFLKNSIMPGPADEIAQYGPGGSDFLPMVGDWDGS